MATQILGLATIAMRVDDFTLDKIFLSLFILGHTQFVRLLQKAECIVENLIANSHCVGNPKTMDVLPRSTPNKFVRCDPSDAYDADRWPLTLQLRFPKKVVPLSSGRNSKCKTVNVNVRTVIMSYYCGGEWAT